MANPMTNSIAFHDNPVPYHPHQEAPRTEGSVKPVKPINPLYLPFLGSALGYSVYWGARLFSKIGLYKPTAPIEAMPYVAYFTVALTVGAIIQSIKPVALYILGERKVAENLEAQSSLDRFRQHSWKVIGPIQDIPKKIDAIYSRTFNISTEEETIQKKIANEDLYLSEIIRRVFIEQISDLPKSAASLFLPNLIVEAIGYPFLTRAKVFNIFKLKLLISAISFAIISYSRYGGTDEDRINRRVTIDQNFLKKLEAEKKANDDKSVAVNANSREIEKVD